MSFLQRCNATQILSAIQQGTIFRTLMADHGMKNVVRLASSVKYSYIQDKDSDLSPQGIQGDDCSSFKLWLENCSRYGFSNCNDQLQGIQSGRKTLAQVLAEQEKMIADIAKEYRANIVDHDGQGVQDLYSALPLDSPCPQGVQGDDCVRYKLWLENCHRFGLQDCMHHYAAFKSGRRTLAEVTSIPFQIFSEQDKMIRDAAAMVAQRRRNYSTSSRSEGTGKHPDSNVDANAESGQSTETELTQRQKLQRAVKEYGSTVIVFHVTISLASLGFFYLLVSSGLDIAGLLMKLDIGGEVLKSKLAAGTGTFVIAYAVHKVFAPVRIAITLTSTPFIVRYLRQIGFLKAPKGANSKKKVD